MIQIEPVPTNPETSTDSTAKQSAFGNGGRKTVLAALEAVLIAKRVPERQRQAVMRAAQENLAQRLRDGQTLKVKVHDKSAPPQRTVEPPKPERQQTWEPVAHVR